MLFYIQLQINIIFYFVDRMYHEKVYDKVLNSYYQKIDINLFGDIISLLLFYNSIC